MNEINVKEIHVVCNVLGSYDRCMCEVETPLLPPQA